MNTLTDLSNRAVAAVASLAISSVFLAAAIAPATQNVTGAFA